MDMKSIFFLIGGAFCHQLPERSIYVAGVQLPVCARCFGVYSSVAVCSLFLAAAKRLSASKPPSLIITLLLSAALLPLMADGFLSYIGIYETTNFVRVTTGALAGCSLMLLTHLAIRFEAGHSERTELIKSPGELGALFGVCLFFTGAAFLLPFGYMVFSLTAVFGILLFWNAVLYCVFRLILNWRAWVCIGAANGLLFVWIVLAAVYGK